MDISDPYSPWEVGFLELPYYSMDLAAAGDLVYVCGQGGMRVFDVSDPATPSEIGIIGIAARDIEIAGDYAFVTAGDYSGLRVVDIADPTSPSMVAILGDFMIHNDIFLSGQYLFMTVDSEGLAVLDVADPADPVLVGSCSLPGNSYRLDVAGDHVFVVTSGIPQGLTAIDITDPTSPTPVGTLNSELGTCQLATSGHLLCAARSEEVSLIDISDAAAMAEVGDIHTAGHTYDVKVRDAFAFVTHADGGLGIFDVSNPASPIREGYLDTWDEAYNVSFAGQYLILDHQYGLSIVDVIDPSSPAVLGTYPEYNSHNLAARGSYIYLPGDEQFRILDITDPTAPFVTGTLGLAGDRRVRVSGDHVFLVHATGPQIIDVTDPTAPVVVGTIANPEIWDLAIDEDIVYATAGTNGLIIYDVSDPASPLEIGSWPFSPLYNIIVSGSYAYAYNPDLPVETF